jgi:hypothetical protein
MFQFLDLVDSLPDRHAFLPGMEHRVKLVGPKFNIL